MPRDGGVTGTAGGAVVPAPSGVARSLARGAAALTWSAGIGAVALFGGGAILAFLLDEVLQLHPAPLEPLFAIAVCGAVVAGAVAAVGGSLRVAAERWLLLGEAERAPGDAPLPAVERAELRPGPHDALRGLGLGLLLAAFGLGVLMLALWDRQEWAGAVRGVLPVLVASGVLAGAPLVIVARRRGRARERWDTRVIELERRWRRGVRTQLRAPRPRSARLLRGAGQALLIGTLVFMIPLLMRKPTRYSDPIHYPAPVERVIDGLLMLGALAITAAAIALSIGWLVSAVRRWAEDRATIRELERGGEVPATRLDALLLERSAGERTAQGLALIGWLLLTVALAPVATELLVSRTAAAPLAPLLPLVAPALVLLVASWLLGARSASRATERRTRVHRLIAHDVLPHGHGR